MSETVEKKLRAQGYRITPQRLAILSILQQADRHLTPNEIYLLSREKVPGITEATVYRTLNFLAEQGIILVAHIGGGQLVYEIGGYDHHHLICRKCNTIIQIDHSLLKNFYDQIEDQTGFRIDSIHTTFFGLCPQCREQVENEG